MKHLSRLLLAALCLTPAVASAMVILPQQEVVDGMPVTTQDVVITLPRRLEGTLTWTDESQQTLALNIRKTRTLDDGRVAFTGWNVYRDAEGAVTRKVMVMGNVDQAWMVRIYEVNETHDFSVADSHFEGELSEGGTIMSLMLRHNTSGADLATGELMLPVRD